MPKAEVVFFCGEDGQALILEWMDELPAKAQDKCTVRIERLAEQGHELRRPEADYLRDGIYELRVKHARVNYRMLYFFFGPNRAVVTHGFSKQEAKVPNKETDRALRLKRAYERRPSTHTYGE